MVFKVSNIPIFWF